MLVAIVASGCGKAKREPAELTRVPEHPAMGVLAPSAAPPTAIDVAEGLAQPEAVVWDPDQDVYFVSNMNGDPADDDDNGFISKLAPSGAPIDLRFIDGAADDVTLHAPRGLALYGDTLYVADNHAVRLFDRITGKPKASWEVPNTTFLNDLAVDAQGVRVTETGIVLLPSGEPVQEVPYRIFGFENGSPYVIAEGDDLLGPNGIEPTPDGDIVLAFMGQEIYRLDHGTKHTVATLPTSKLDGVIVLPDGSFLVSSWEAKGIYHVDGSGKPPVLALQGLVTAASIGYDASRHRVLIPETKPNLVHIEPWP